MHPILELLMDSPVEVISTNTVKFDLGEMLCDFTRQLQELKTLLFTLTGGAIFLLVYSHIDDADAEEFDLCAWINDDCLYVRLPEVNQCQIGTGCPSADGILTLTIVVPSVQIDDEMLDPVLQIVATEPTRTVSAPTS